MQCTPNTTFAEILKNSTVLHDMFNKAKQLDELNKSIKQHLESGLAKNCRVANLIQGRLILATTSSAWNLRLKFIKQELLSKLRKEPNWCGLISIESFIQLVEIDNDVNYSQIDSYDKLLPKPKKLSAANCELLAAVAKQTTIKELATALLKLAKHHSKE